MASPLKAALATAVAAIADVEVAAPTTVEVLLMVMIVSDMREGGNKKISLERGKTKNTDRVVETYYFENLIRGSKIEFQGI